VIVLVAGLPAESGVIWFVSKSVDENASAADP
jgi:hypothetical protein